MTSLPSAVVRFLTCIARRRCRAAQSCARPVGESAITGMQSRLDQTKYGLCATARLRAVPRFQCGVADLAGHVLRVQLGPMGPAALPLCGLSVAALQDLPFRSNTSPVGVRVQYMRIDRYRQACTEWLNMRISWLFVNCLDADKGVR